METKACPDCSELVPVTATMCGCGFRFQRGAMASRPQADEPLTPRHAFSSHDLTAQQWYNVCRWFPTVAARCSRALPDIGPHNPLHATSEEGPLMRALRGKSIAGIEPDKKAEAERRRLDAVLRAEADAERSAIAGEPALAGVK